MTGRHHRVPARKSLVRRAPLVVTVAGGLLAAILVIPAITGLGGDGYPFHIQTASADTAPQKSAAATTRRLAIKTLSARLGLSSGEAARRLDAQPAQARTAGLLIRQLGARAAGTFLDDTTGNLVVNVTDNAAATTVTAAGAHPRMVSRTNSRLGQVKAALDRTGRIPGTAWAVDASSNTVTVQMAPSAKSDRRAAAWMKTLAGYGDAVRVVHQKSSYTTQAFLGGQAIFDVGRRIRCSSAFNATAGGRAYVITAGHCTAAVQSWSDGTQAIGASTVSSFPGNDFGVIAVNDPVALDPQAALLDNGRRQAITGFLSAPIGGLVCKTGSTTGTTCGTVQATNATVVYPEGQVNGLIQTDVCTQSGDSGGSLFAADQAQGIVSGGSVGACDQPGFVSFFQPIDEVLQATGLTLE